MTNVEVAYLSSKTASKSVPRAVITHRTKAALPRSSLIAPSTKSPSFPLRHLEVERKAKLKTTHRQKRNSFHFAPAFNQLSLRCSVPSSERGWSTIANHGFWKVEFAEHQYRRRHLAIVRLPTCVTLSFECSSWFALATIFLFYYTTVFRPSCYHVFLFFVTPHSSRDIFQIIVPKWIQSEEKQPSSQLAG